MVIRNEDVKELKVEIPEAHEHMRATVVLMDGTKMTFQEATIANLVRAYITIKTHPGKYRIHLKGTLLKDKKKGYAEWQLIESG